MSDGFQVTMADLKQAAGVFRTESGTFGAIMPQAGPASASTGSFLCDEALSAVLAAIGGLHDQLAGVIAAHGTKLEAAYGTYRDAENKIVKLSTSIATVPPGS